MLQQATTAILKSLRSALASYWRQMEAFQSPFHKEHIQVPKYRSKSCGLPHQQRAQAPCNRVFHS